MNAIGIDLYLKMLEQTVEELKGAPAKIEVRTSLNLGLDIKIPDPYIPDENQRLRMYKRISSCRTRTRAAELEAELADRFGAIPPSVSNLLNYALLKSAAERCWCNRSNAKGTKSGSSSMSRRRSIQPAGAVRAAASRGQLPP